MRRRSSAEADAARANLDLVGALRREADRTELRLWETTLALIRIAQIDETYVMTAAELAHEALAGQCVLGMDAATLDADRLGLFSKIIRERKERQS